MTSDLVAGSGLLLMFVLGLRHGLDPDHIACIDGLTWRAITHQHTQANWIGALFALGHGAVVTLIAVTVSQMTLSIEPSPFVAEVFEWVPSMLLIVVGCLNLRLLLRANADFELTGWKMSLIPRRLRQSSNVGSVMVIGMLFAAVFDTATQAAAWGYVASNKEIGAWAALWAGLSFTAGMMITDTLDSQIISRIGQSAGGAAATRRVRRSMGWFVIVISFGVAIYNILKACIPKLELNDFAFTLSGVFLIIFAVGIWALCIWFFDLKTA